MKLPKTAHAERAWRIHEIAADFRVEDVWGLPTPGGPDDFPRLVAMMVSGNPLRGSSLPVRVLTAIREGLGGRLGWDDEASAVGSRVSSLRQRLPVELRDTEPPTFTELPFESLYLVEDEFAAEAANRTMHGVLHLGWVPDERGGYSGQMTILVKPNGMLGKAYMAAIKPFRYLIVYPALMRYWKRAWQRRTAAEATR